MSGVKNVPRGKLSVLTLRQHIFARARQEVASPGGHDSGTPGASEDVSAEQRGEGSRGGAQGHHVDAADVNGSTTRLSG